MTDYFFGEIPGNPVGTTYANRTAAMRAGVHQINMAGIAGNRAVGCVSICVNGGYEDDEDHGDWIIYTGEGGNENGHQVADQSLKSSGNAALVVSRENGYPVRVLRGPKDGSNPHAPAHGFRYDGLYQVTDHWVEEGLRGFQVCRYRLDRLPSDDLAPFIPAVPATAVKTKPAGTKRPGKTTGTVQRTVRNTKVTDWVKHLYKFVCQVCDVDLSLPVGHYAEGAHIRALGAPHFGPDEVENVLCLCPNDHVLLDNGGIYITDDFEVYDHTRSFLTRLTLDAKHDLDVAHLQSHRERFGH